jgi:hypothetical protein
MMKVVLTRQVYNGNRICKWYLNNFLKINKFNIYEQREKIKLG